MKKIFLVFVFVGILSADDKPILWSVEDGDLKNNLIWDSVNRFSNEKVSSKEEATRICHREGKRLPTSSELIQEYKSDYNPTEDQVISHIEYYFASDAIEKKGQALRCVRDYSPIMEKEIESNWKRDSKMFLDIIKSLQPFIVDSNDSALKRQQKEKSCEAELKNLNKKYNGVLIEINNPRKEFYHNLEVQNVEEETVCVLKNGCTLWNSKYAPSGKYIAIYNFDIFLGLNDDDTNIVDGNMARFTTKTVTIYHKISSKSNALNLKIYEKISKLKLKIKKIHGFCNGSVFSLFNIDAE